MILPYVSLGITVGNVVQIGSNKEGIKSSVEGEGE